MIYRILYSLGWLFAKLPNAVLEAFCSIGGMVVYTFFPSRRRRILRDLHGMFPDKSEGWRKNLAKTSCKRLIEMGCLAFGGAFFSKTRILKSLKLSPEALVYLTEMQQRSGREGSLCLVPHMCLSEMLTFVPALLKGKVFEVGIVYRSLNQRVLDEWVQRTRGRFGAKLFPRQKGFFRALNFLKKGGTLAILFDQNAGLPGVLSTFNERLASMTELPELCFKKVPVPVHILWIERISFFSGTVHIQKIADRTDSAAPLTLLAHKWLEGYLCSSFQHAAEWLWFHDRWRTQAIDWQRFRIESKRKNLPKRLARKTRYLFRMPNWLGDVVMALPLIRAVRNSRPDVQITALVQPHFVDFLEKTELFDQFEVIPSKRLGIFRYYKHFWGLSKLYPDLQFLFTNSLRGDLEAFLIGAPHRMGILRKDAWRPLLTHYWTVGEKIEEAKMHQTEFWRRAFAHFGLNEPLDYSVLPSLRDDLARKSVQAIGFICGTENSPEKRWKVASWQKLIEAIHARYPQKALYLFGTKNDLPITESVLAGVSCAEKVQNLAGQTTLLGFMEKLKNCERVICNDTGGMHLANALGVPIVGLFGPTNPIRTGPIFETPKTLLLDKTVRPGEVGSMDNISVEEVLAYI